MKLYVILIIILFICIYYYRDIKLRIMPAETLAGVYMALPRGSSHKSVIYFYLDQSNINSFEKTLNSILDQSRRVDYIYISIDENVECEIPSYLSKIAFVEMQSSTAVHFRNSILREKESYVNIIFLNSNIIYKKDFIYNLIKNVDGSTEPVVAADFMYASPCMFNECISLDKKIFIEKNINFINFF